MNFGRAALGIGTVVLLAVPAFPEEPDLITDRPDQTESAIVVPQGTVQLEIGWTFTREEENGLRTETSEAAGTLVRVGLGQTAELRIGWDGYLSVEQDLGGFETDADGPGDAAIGAKFHLREERGRAPQMALLVETTVPTGSDEFSSDDFDPAFRIAASHELTDRLGLAYNAGLVWSTESGDTLSGYLYTAVLGIGISEKLGAFVELYGLIPASAPGGPANSFDGGVTYLVTRKFQLDLAGGVGLSSAADDWFVGLGLSVRFPR